MKRFLALSLFGIATIAGAWPRSSHVVIAPPTEPGQRLIVTGHVFGADGKPAAGVAMFAYQTDAQGYYRADHRMSGADTPPRLGGWLRVADDGSYAIETIKPAPYPNRNIPAHIHVNFKGRDVSAQDDTIWFDDAHPLPRDANGVLHCTHDVRLK